MESTLNPKIQPAVEMVSKSMALLPKGFVLKHEFVVHPRDFTIICVLFVDDEKWDNRVEYEIIRVFNLLKRGYYATAGEEGTPYLTFRVVPI